MANIRVDLGYTIKNGTEVVFRSPVDCSAITGLIVYYPDEDGATTSTVFVLADAHGNNVGDIDHLFAENVVVKVILDVTSAMAFVQNADTNAYLEGRFEELLPREELPAAINEALAQAKASGEFDGDPGEPGQPGYTPVKGVDYFDGEPGQPGEPGYTPVKGVDYFDGQPGEPGQPGYTPQKGVDYFTDEEVAGIAEQAANACAQQMGGAFAPASHASDKNNPHGVTPSQIGAAPVNSNYMLLGVEYLAQEYWNGTPVYTKMIAFTPNSFSSQTISLPHEIQGLNIGLSIDVLWKYVNTDGNVTWRRFPSVYYGNVEWNGQAYFEGADNIKFELGGQTKSNMAKSTDNIYVTLKYTKA